MYPSNVTGWVAPWEAAFRQTAMCLSMARAPCASAILFLVASSCMSIKLSAEQRSELQRLYAGGRNRSAVGFKTKLKDVADLDLLRSCIAERDLVVILMRRRDLLRLAISRINARRLHAETGRWNVRGSDRRVGGADVTVEELVDALTRCRDDVRRLDDFVASSGVTPCEIEYADILAEPEAVFAKVQELLGVERRPLASSVVKNTRQDLAGAVGNIDALRRELASSEWSSVFQVDPISERRPSNEG